MNSRLLLTLTLTLVLVAGVGCGGPSDDGEESESEIRAGDLEDLEASVPDDPNLLARIEELARELPEDSDAEPEDAAGADDDEAKPWRGDYATLIGLGILSFVLTTVFALTAVILRRRRQDAVPFPVGDRERHTMRHYVVKAEEGPRPRRHRPGPAPSGDPDIRTGDLRNGQDRLD